jgi:energy-coupling factor transporter ATP-binding protein EcfA2
MSSPAAPLVRPLVQVEGLYKLFQSNSGMLPVLREVRFSVAEGEFVCIMGPSGSGKTTLLHILSGLDAPSAGTIALRGRDLQSLSERQRTLEPCRQALADAGLKPEDIEEAVLVGGSTRIPLVRRAVAELFGRTPHADLNPDEVVALGAAVQADILVSGRREMLLLDVTPLSLGIETMGGVTSKIILRNSTIPASGREMFTTAVDNQTAEVESL